MVELYTHSRLAAFRMCPRKHYFRYELGAHEMRPAGALRFGTAFHEGAKAYWLLRQSGSLASADDRVDVALAGARRRPLDDPFDREKLDAMIVAYVGVWDGWRVTVEHVELPFELPLRHPDTHETHPRARLGGQMDLILRSPRTGNVAVTEHKTSSRDVSPGNEYVYRLQMDGQIGVYFHAAESLGMNPTEVIYDVAVKPLHRPRQGGRGKPAETPEEYGERVRAVVTEKPEAFIRRIRVARPEREQTEVWRDVWSWVGKIERAASEGDWPRNPDACFKFGTACEFFPVCTGRVEIDDPAIYIRADKHAELRDEAARTMTPDDELGF